MPLNLMPIVIWPTCTFILWREQQTNWKQIKWDNRGRRPCATLTKGLNIMRLKTPSPLHWDFHLSGCLIRNCLFGPITVIPRCVRTGLTGVWSCVLSQGQLVWFWYQAWPHKRLPLWLKWMFSWITTKGKQLRTIVKVLSCFTRACWIQQLLCLPGRWKSDAPPETSNFSRFCTCLFSCCSKCCSYSVLI